MKVKVLIVDDDIAGASALKKVLEQRALVVSLATSLRGGLEEFSIFCPNVIVLDADLGDSSGFETMAAIPKFLERDASCAVVVYSSFDEEELAIAAFRNGATDFIFKNGDANVPQRVMWAHFRNIYARKN